MGFQLRFSALRLSQQQSTFFIFLKYDQGNRVRCILQDDVSIALLGTNMLAYSVAVTMWRSGPYHPFRSLVAAAGLKRLLHQNSFQWTNT